MRSDARGPGVARRGLGAALVAIVLSVTLVSCGGADAEDSFDPSEVEYLCDADSDASFLCKPQVSRTVLDGLQPEERPTEFRYEWTALQEMTVEEFQNLQATLRSDEFVIVGGPDGVRQMQTWGQANGIGPDQISNVFRGAGTLTSPSCRSIPLRFLFLRGRVPVCTP
jgi:hypothetical protein